METIDGGGLYVSGNIHGAEVEWLIDTGCNLTLLSETAYHRIPVARRPILKPYYYSLSAANGDPLKALGKANFQMEIGGRIVTTQ